MPANGARTTVSATALRASATRARAASSDRYDCCGAVQRHLVLLPRRLDLRAPLVELRSATPPSDRAASGCGANSASAKSSDALRVHHVGHALRIERLARREAEPRFDLRGVGFRFLQLRRRSRSAEIRTSSAPGADARAAFDRRPDDAAGGLGADLRLFVGDQRAGDAQVAFDRPALDGHDGNRGRLGAAVAASAADARAVRCAPVASERQRRGARLTRAERTERYMNEYLTECLLGGRTRTTEASEARRLRSPASAASSVSCASASASSPGASRSHSCMTATPWTAAIRMRNTACGSMSAREDGRRRSPAGSVRRSGAASSRTNPNRSQSWLMRGTERSRNISAKYSGCALLNS